MANPKLTQLQESMNSLTDLVRSNNEAMTIDIQNIKSDITHIKDVTSESEAVKEQLFSTQGKVTRLEVQNQHMQEKLVSYEAKMYERDLMFYNITDTQDESFIALKATVYTIMKRDMKIPEDEIFSKVNPVGEIRIDTAVRIGKYIQGKTRPVAVTFITKTGRNTVYSRKYNINLKTPIKVRVAEHYPAIGKTEHSKTHPYIIFQITI